MPPPKISVEVSSVEAKRDIDTIKTALKQLRDSIKGPDRAVNEFNATLRNTGKNVKNIDLKTLSFQMGVVKRSTKGASTAFAKSRREADKMNRAFDKSRKSIKGMKGQMTQLSKSIQIALGPLSGVAARVTAFSSLATGASLVIAGLIAGFIGMAAIMVKTVKVGSEMEKNMLAIEAVLKATSSTVGFTTQQIDAFSQSVANVTLANVNQIREASAVLLTFVTVQGNAFKRSIRLSQDLAQLGFGSARNAAVQLGKALEDPKIGLTALRRVGVSFTKQLREQIETLTDLGKTAEAVDLILGNLESQVGGVGEAAARGLAGAFDTLNDQITKFFEITAKDSILLNTLKTVIDGLSGALASFNQELKPPSAEQLFSDYERALEAAKALEKKNKDIGKGTGSALGDIKKAAEAMFKLATGGQFFTKDLGIKEAIRLSGDLSIITQRVNEVFEDIEDQDIGAHYLKIGKEAKSLQVSQDALQSSLDKIREKVEPGVKALKDYKKAVAIVNEAVKELDDFTREMGDETIRRLDIAFANAANSARFWDKAMRKAMQTAAQANRILKRTIDRRNAAFEATEQQIESIIRESQALLISGKNRKVTLEILKAQIRLKKADIKLDDEGAIKLIASLKKVAELREEVRKITKREQEAVRDFTQIIGGAFEDALVKGGNFRELLAGIEQDLIRIATRIFITKPFEAAFEAGTRGEGVDKDEQSPGIAGIGNFLGKQIKSLFGLGGTDKKKSLSDALQKAQELATATQGDYNISTQLASTAVQELAEAAIEASIALRTLKPVTAADIKSFDVDKSIRDFPSFGAPGLLDEDNPLTPLGAVEDDDFFDFNSALKDSAAVVSKSSGSLSDAMSKAAAGVSTTLDPLSKIEAEIDAMLGAAKAFISGSSNVGIAAGTAATALQDTAAQSAAAAGKAILLAAAETSTTASTIQMGVAASSAAASLSAVAASGGGGGGGLLGGVGSLLGGGGGIGLGSTGLDAAGFGGTVGGFLGPFASGGVASSRGKVNLHAFDSGGIADSPTIALFGEKKGVKEAFVPLDKGRAIPVEIRGGGGFEGVGLTVNGPLMHVETRDADSFNASPDQTLGQLDAFLLRSRRNK